MLEGVGRRFTSARDTPTPDFLALSRIAAKKTGLFVPLKELTVSSLTLLLEQVLDDSTYRDNARHFQKAIAKTNGLSKAADLLEQAFGFANEDQQLLAQ